MAGQRFATPVRRDMTEHAMFDLVPFAGTGRKVANRQTQTGVIGQSLQGHFPQPCSAAVAAPAIGQDQ
jgi:hypothetical protein